VYILNRLGLNVNFFRVGRTEIFRGDIMSAGKGDIYWVDTKIIEELKAVER
jgi:hypothetical protein